MIGYYVHHVGRGHVRNAVCIAPALDHEVVGLSSLRRPAEWPGPWIELDRDDAAPAGDPSAHGRLHWAPLHDRGLATRMARVAAWIADVHPAAMVVDVSVEVAVLVRLMGVPVVVMALPGDRSDPAHQLGFSLADAIIAAWPPGMGEMDRDLHPWADRVHHVGGLSRFARRRATEPAPGRRRRVVVLQGTGGTSVRPADVAAAAAATPDWDWQRLGPGAWSEDPWTELCAADVVVAHAGLGALADVAAAARPAVVVPEDRPHGEQRATARALADAGLVVASELWPRDHDWPDVLTRALGTGSGWQRWLTDGAAERAATVIEAVAADQRCLRPPPCA